MDDKSGESTEKGDGTDTGRGESEVSWDEVDVIFQVHLR